MKIPKIFQSQLQWGKIFDIFCLGSFTLVGAIYFTWNPFAEVGFITLVWTYVVFGASYLALVLVIGELLCAFPFKGGAFGFVRCAIGLFPGYLAGCGEATYYIVLGSLNIVFLAQLISEQFSVETKYVPILWIALYAIACGINTHQKSSAFFWRFTDAMAIICLFLVFMYCFGSLSKSQQRVLNKIEFISGNVYNTVKYFPQAAWFFIGIESLALACNTTSLKRETIAVGSVICLVTIFLTNLLGLCITFSLFENPAILASTIYPLNEGYISFLGCTPTQASYLAFPSTFGALITFMFSHGKMICALSESGLLPKFLSKKTTSDCPSVALISGSVIGYCICWPLYFFPQTMGSAVPNFCYLAAFTTYSLYSIGYIVLKKQYLTGIVYSFQNPFGVFGAGYVILIFALGTTSLIFFQGSIPWGLVIYVGVLLVASIYYFAFAKSMQRFSEEEQRCVTFAFTQSRIISVQSKTVSKKIQVLPLNDRAERKDWELQQAAGIKLVTQEIQDEKPCARRNSSIPFAFKVVPLGSQQCVAGIHKLLMEKDRAIELRMKAELKFCVENVDFCQQAILYKQKAEGILSEGTLYANLTTMHSSFIQIAREFICNGSPNEVNISAKLKADILKMQDLRVYSALHPLKMVTMFDEAVAEVERVLRDNIKM